MLLLLLLLLLLLPPQPATARTHTQQSKPKLQDSTNQAATTGSEVPYLHTVGSGAGALAARFAALLGTEEPLGSEDIAALTRSLRCGRYAFTAQGYACCRCSAGFPAAAQAGSPRSH